ncbi:MAG: exodeoxyribonuclease III [Erysipelotrichaceae bacterium]|nr:exodeoxyribonuclease III [Erysipelotrichaceae bacterium]
MKMVSWNVAGFRACLKKGFAEFFDREQADVYCLQEVKAELHQIDFDPEGYFTYINPAEKKGYSGTLIYSRVEPLSVSYGMGIDEHDHEGRMITLEFEDYYLVNEYVPNVKRELTRLDYRMVWEDDFRRYLKKLEEKKPVIVCGDFNVAHTEMDIKNAKSNIGNAGFTYEERGKFTELLAAGFIDTFRYKNPDVADKYTWWSFMNNARGRNIGWRIDYFVVSEALKDRIADTIIYDEVLGSDHCPIGLVID